MNSKVEYTKQDSQVKVVSLEHIEDEEDLVALEGTDHHEHEGGDEAVGADELDPAHKGEAKTAIVDQTHVETLQKTITSEMHPLLD